MSNDQENRRSFRIIETAVVSFETVSDLDYKQGFEFWKMSQGTGVGVRSKLLDIEARFNQKMFHLKTESVALAECLLLLNEKITAVVEELPGIKETKVSLARQTPQSCELGAEGMTFSAAQTYPPETKLALRFLLATDNLYIETFCRVVRTVEPLNADDPSRPYGLAVEFLGMKPDQKDILIQHMFDRESETLRMRRLEIDADKIAQQRD